MSNLPPGVTLSDIGGPDEPEPDVFNMDREELLAWLDEHDVDVDEALRCMTHDEWEKMQ